MDTHGTPLFAGYGTVATNSAEETSHSNTDVADMAGRYPRKALLLDWGNMDHLDNLGTHHHNRTFTLTVNRFSLDKSWFGPRKIPPLGLYQLK